MKIAIIGGGASGTVLAIRLRKKIPQSDVVLFERDKKLLQKVKMSGNGRCNLSHSVILPDKYLHPELIKSMLEAGYEQESYHFFAQLGLITYEEDGRIYPFSNQSQSVVELLKRSLYYSGVKVCLNTEITKITCKNGGYCLNDNPDIFDYVVLAVGSNAYLSNDTKQYEIVRKMGIELTELTPALVGFQLKKKIPELFGVRTTVSVSYLNHQSSGELMFKEDGISGICIMDLSLFYDRNKSQQIIVNFLPGFTKHTLQEFIEMQCSNDQNLHLHQLFAGVLPLKLLAYLNANYQNRLVSELSQKELSDYLACFTNHEFTIQDTYDFTKAQVTRGGISLDELENFSLKKYPKMYAVGEVVDQSGICGGYNLWFATTSALMVADQIAKKMGDDHAC